MKKTIIINEYLFHNNKTSFELSNGIKFTIYHDLPNIPGICIQDAFQNWLVRTNNYDAKSFVKYINSKQTGYFALTEKEYKQAVK